jgi:hypothetical protein
LTPEILFAFDRTLGALRDLVEVHGFEEGLSGLELGFTIVDGLSSLVVAFSFSEHNTEHSVVGLEVGITILSSLAISEFLGGRSSLGMGEHDEMHLEVVVLTVDGVLTRGVNMELVGLVV